MRIYNVADGLGGLMFVSGPCSPEEGGPQTNMDIPSYSVRPQWSLYTVQLKSEFLLPLLEYYVRLSVESLSCHCLCGVFVSLRV